MLGIQDSCPQKANEMTPYERVEQELKELCDREEKLRDFLSLYQTAIEFDMVELGLLRLQLQAMSRYEEILRARLLLWKNHE
jgi:hypothetical protein